MTSLTKYPNHLPECEKRNNCLFIENDKQQWYYEKLDILNEEEQFTAGWTNDPLKAMAFDCFKAADDYIIPAKLFTLSQSVKITEHEFIGECTCGLEQALKECDAYEKPLLKIDQAFRDAEKYISTLESNLRAVERFRAEDAMSAINEANALREGIEITKKQLSDLTTDYEDLTESSSIKEFAYKETIESLNKQLSDLHEGANQRAQRLIDQSEIEKAKFEAEIAELKQKLEVSEDNFRASMVLREIAGKMGEALKYTISVIHNSHEYVNVQNESIIEQMPLAEETLSAYTQYIKENESTQPKG